MVGEFTNEKYDYCYTGCTACICGFGNRCKSIFKSGATASAANAGF